jgi:ferredoxin
MNADGAAEIDYDRCIGCGLCISACPDDALSLVPKPGEKRDVPVENLHEQLVRATKRRRGEEVDEKQVVSFGFDQTD